MPFAVSHAAAADAPAIANIWAAAFADDVLERALWADVPMATRVACATALGARCIGQPPLHVLAAADAATGVIAAFAIWERLPADALHEEPPPSPPPPAVPLPAAADHRLSAMFRATFNAAHRALMHGRDHYHLVLLATSPAYQRQGAARALTAWGTAAADAAGIPAYVEASSPASRSLYAAHGWAVVRELVLDLHDFGTPAVQRQWCMVREPQDRPVTNGRVRDTA